MSLMRLTINGEERTFEEAMSVEQLLGCIGLDPRKVAVERNLEIVAKSTYPETPLADGDRLEIVHFIGGGAPDDAPVRANADDAFDIAGNSYRSRLLVGTGKYKDFEQTARAIEASGAEMRPALPGSRLRSRPTARCRVCEKVATAVQRPGSGRGLRLLLVLFATASRSWVSRNAYGQPGGTTFSGPRVARGPQVGHSSFEAV